MGRVEERSRDGQGHSSEELDTSENLCSTQGTHSLLCGDRNAQEIHKTGDVCIPIADLLCCKVGANAAL